MKKIIIPVLFLASLCMNGTVLAQTIRYVKPNNAGAANGSSWANASKDLQLMIDNSAFGDMIFVAAGVYARIGALSLIMKEGVKIYGGFAGTETQLSQRNWVTNISTITNPNLGPAINNDNNGLTNAALLDGFTIAGRSGDQPLQGTGLSNNNSSPYIINCTFSNCVAITRGGAVYNTGGASPVFTNCSFINCVSPQGGAMYNDGASPIITNCSFSINRASNNGTLSSGRGGAIFNAQNIMYGTAPVIKRCVFSGNQAEQCGAGLFNGEISQPAIDNCLFLNNEGPGAGMYNERCLPTITGCTFTGSKFGSHFFWNDGPSTIINAQSISVIRNCIIWGNQVGVRDSLNPTTTIEYSIVQGGYAGTGNLNADPNFDANYGLQICSPAIDAGSNLLVPGGTTTDLAGLQRIRGTAVDMGAYEFRPQQPAAGNILYVNTNINPLISDVSGSSWTNAIQSLSDALQYAKKYESNWTAANPLKIFVATGTYTPKKRPDILCTTDPNDRNNSFPMVSNVQLYGGFDPDNGIDDLSDNRVIGPSGSILNGDIGAAGNNTDNCYHVVTASGILFTATLDGFTISGGQANGSGDLAFGGGIFISNASPVINHCIISSNNAADRAGGIYINGISSPLIDACSFSTNTAGFFGAGMFNQAAATPTLNRCIFSGNSTQFGGALYNEGMITAKACGFYNNTAASFGGGVYHGWNISSYINCVFSGNTTINFGGGGGGLFNNNGAPVISNCTFSSNTADLGAAVHNFNTGSASIRNSVIWGNASTIYNEPSASASVQFSLVQGGYTGIGNVNADPLFLNASAPLGIDGVSGTPDDGLRLQPCSPAVNAGDNSLVGAGITSDLIGIPRTQFSTVDLGAYESSSMMNATAANLVSTNTVVSAWQFSNNQTWYGPNCNTLIASLTGDGNVTSVSGNTSVKIWIETAQSKGFVKRHFEITPLDISPATASGTATLYFTQAEFDAFNAMNTIKLPQGPSDAAGKANLLIEKRSGVSSDNSGLPASYPGTITTIDPNDANIVWNSTALRWEVSFAVTGFSGFFVKTNTLPLPLRLLRFSAEEKNCVVTLQWITADEISVSHYEAEQSTNGISYSTVQTVVARNTPGENKYTITVPAGNSTLYYRLKMVDNDGSVKYSQVNVVTPNCLSQIQVYPNPAFDRVYISNATVGNFYSVYDNVGHLVKTGRISNSMHTIQISGLTPGIYYINIPGSGQESRKLKFIKN